MPFTRTATFTGHRSGVYALAPGDRPGTFLSAGGDGQIVRWGLDRPDDGELIASVDEAVYSVHHAVNERLLFIGEQQGGLRVLDLESKREIRRMEVHRKGIFSMVPLTDGRLACAGGDGSISIWRVNGVELLRQIPISDQKVRALEVSPQGRWLASGDSEGQLRLFDTTDLNEHHRSHAHEGGCHSVAWHPSKPVLVSGGKDGYLRLWHKDGHLVLAVPAHSGTIYRIAFSPDGSVCATASRDKTVKLWDAASFDPLQRLDRSSGGHAHSVNAALWVDRTLITAGDDRAAIAWAQNG